MTVPDLQKTLGTQRGRWPHPNRWYGVPSSLLIAWVLPAQADQEEGDAVNQFLAKHAGSVIGTLSGFDRLVFTGTLRHLAYPAGLKLWLWAASVLLKDFAAHAEAMTRRLKEASEALARRTGRPILYLRSATASKEAIARKIAREDGIETGLICILTAVEPCWSFQIRRGRDEKRLFLEPATRKCLFLYHYQIHPLFGFMHARIQTWAPFRIQICLNGREWLARGMDKAGLGYVRRENCFTWLEDPDKAQRLMNRQVQAAWPDLLNAVAHQLNPAHEEMFRGFPVQYYWSAHQTEWATDILFRDARTLAGLYPKLVQHGLTTFLSPDVMRFLGRNIPPPAGHENRRAALGCGGVHARSGGLFLELNVKSHGGQAAHEVLRCSFAVEPVQESSPQVLVERTVGQHVPDRDQDFMGDRDSRPHLPPSRGKSAVFLSEVCATAAAAAGDRRRHQCGLQEDVSLPALS
jgi:hypothetical protein